MGDQWRAGSERQKERINTNRRKAIAMFLSLKQNLSMHILHTAFHVNESNYRKLRCVGRSERAAGCVGSTVTCALPDCLKLYSKYLPLPLRLRHGPPASRPARLGHFVGRIC